MITERQPVSVAGFTQASRVRPLARSSDGESGTLTRSLTPSKLSADPKRPCAPHVAPEIMPLLFWPDESAAVAPAPVSRPYAPTRPLGGGGEPPLDTVTATGDD